MAFKKNLEEFKDALDLYIAGKKYGVDDGQDHSFYTDDDAGSTTGKISELTVLGTFKEGGADRLRKIAQIIGSKYQAIISVGTIHDLRFVIIDNDTRLIFASTFDGTWDTYINDFATKIPEVLDVIFDCLEGWPGIKDPTVKEYIKSIQHTSIMWYASHPNLTVTDITRQNKIVAGINKVLDEASLTFER